jgi:hypothetical protein
MSKGDSPRPGKKKPLPTPKPTPKPKGKGGNGGGPPAAPDCWTFPLTSPTPGAREAKRGMSVVGVPQGSRISIQGPPGVLGYAPSDVAAKMIAALRRSGGTLAGQIVLDNDARGGVQVQLCIS